MSPENAMGRQRNFATPRGGSALWAYMVTAAPVGSAGRQAAKGDTSPFNPLTKCSSVIVADARF